VPRGCPRAVPASPSPSPHGAANTLPLSYFSPPAACQPGSHEAKHTRSPGTSLLLLLLLLPLLPRALAAGRWALPCREPLRHARAPRTVRHPAPSGTRRGPACGDGEPRVTRGGRRRGEGPGGRGTARALPRVTGNPRPANHAGKCWVCSFLCRGMKRRRGNRSSWDRHGIVPPPQRAPCPSEPGREQPKPASRGVSGCPQPLPEAGSRVQGAGRAQGSSPKLSVCGSTPMPPIPCTPRATHAAPRVPRVCAALGHGTRRAHQPLASPSSHQKPLSAFGVHLPPCPSIPSPPSRSALSGSPRSCSRLGKVLLVPEGLGATRSPSTRWRGDTGGGQDSAKVTEPAGVEGGPLILLTPHKFPP